MDDNHWVFEDGNKGFPARTPDGRNLRKAIFEAVTGVKPPHGAQPVKCGVRRCMNPSHITGWVEPGNAAS